MLDSLQPPERLNFLSARAPVLHPRYGLIQFMHKVAQAGTRLSLWNGTGYVNYNRTLGGWGDASAVVLTPGQGFWVSYDGLTFPSATNLSLVKPYTWP